MESHPNLEDRRTRWFKLSVGQARESRENQGSHLVEEERNVDREKPSYGEIGRKQEARQDDIERGAW